jgi:hypothetical protein
MTWGRCSRVKSGRARAVHVRLGHTPGVRATTPTRRASEGSGAGRELPRWRVGLVWTVRWPGVNRFIWLVTRVMSAVPRVLGGRGSCRVDCGLDSAGASSSRPFVTVNKDQARNAFPVPLTASGCPPLASARSPSPGPGNPPAGRSAPIDTIESRDHNTIPRTGPDTTPTRMLPSVPPQAGWTPPKARRGRSAAHGGNP